MCNVLFGENEVINVKCNGVPPIISGNLEAIRMWHFFPGPPICHRIWVWILNHSIVMADNHDVCFKIVEDFEYSQYKEMITITMVYVYMYMWL